ncbi:TRAF-interacting protein with FHA domain-containing protein A isoform X1 [Gallus gallus]|uniref:TRAF-interacting protein with FHA domain-containing protein A n=1 Tax=Gallus gallus TaxID=9031 RepID=E1BXY0_CHICK|nr:TRAF-interacting protein with FHA domain-containing protein A isoform X1 [Gallus gallus]|eukprot:XP_420645.2 TRAF-interacting protein with FHA domain-containing protein A isoform X2 [Gallus gallus]
MQRCTTPGFPDGSEPRCAQPACCSPALGRAATCQIRLPTASSHLASILSRAQHLRATALHTHRTHFIMTSFEEDETEETATCLHMTFYHPCQQDKMMFRCLNFCKREQVRADEMAKFGRDSNVCHYNLVDTRVSRIQFSLQFYRKLNSSEFCFEIKNMSKKTKLTVDQTELGYLNKVDLPWKCIICFGDYQILAEIQEGEAMDYFETHLHLAKVPILQERCLPSLQPVPEKGIFPSLSPSQGKSPIEIDENESC